AHVFETTRRSPGLINRTNSQLSRANSVFDRSGFAPVYFPSRRHSFGNFGLTCASSFTFATGFPPWHAVQLNPTASFPSLSLSSVSVVPYLCIGSINPWHDTHPSTFTGA